MARFILYTLFIGFLLYTIPLPGTIKESNKLSELLFLADNQLAVTFPWKGILIRPGLSHKLKIIVLMHEQCHIKQIDEHGVMFMVEFYKNPDKFEEECYRISNLLAFFMGK